MSKNGSWFGLPRRDLRQPRSHVSAPIQVTRVAVPGAVCETRGGMLVARVLLLVVSLGFVSSGCSRASDSRASEQSRSGDSKAEASVRPAECRSATNGPSTTALTSQCADAIFKARLTENGSDKLKKLGEEKQLGFGHGMCAYAQSLAASTAPKPTYEDLVKSTSESWGVDRSIVDEIVKIGDVLCPDAMKLIATLADSTELPVLTLSVTGTGSGAVTFTLPDGKPLTENVQGGWQQTIELRVPYDFNMSVQPTAEGSLGCEVRVGDKVISSSEVDPGTGTASCAASIAEIREAIRGG